MFRKTIMVASVLIAAAFFTCGEALASQHHLHQTHSFHRTTASHVARSERHLRLSSHLSRHGRYHVASARAGRKIRRAVEQSSAPVEAGAVQPVAVSSAGAQTGRASYYGGGRTASGGRVGAATCAHRTLPFGTRVLVTNLANAHQAVLTVNDRGPFVRGRVVDVSIAAAGTLGMLHSGTAPVSVQVISGRG